MNEEEISQALELPLSDDDLSDGLENGTDDCARTFYRRISKEPARIDLDKLSSELLSAFKVVQYCAKNKSASFPFINPVGKTNFRKDPNQYQVGLQKIFSDILAQKYDSIQSVVADLRLMLENCYRHFEDNHPFIKKALKLEAMIEEKLALLPSNLHEQTVLESTSPHLASTYRKIREHPDVGDAKAGSIVYQCVREEKAQEEREHLRLLAERRLAEEASAHQEAIRWEEAVLGPHILHHRNMWEVPQIGHFLYLARNALNIPEISQYELERSIFMPSASSLLAIIMTSLLRSHYQRFKIDTLHSMSYKTWEKKLKVRVQQWYKVYFSTRRNFLKVFNLIGIEPDFFKIMGDVNPFEDKSFQELTPKQRVWVLKSLCDYTFHSDRSVQDSITEADVQDQNMSLLGEDREGNLYLYFPLFCRQAIRIYCMNGDMDFPQVDPPSHVEVLKELPDCVMNNRGNLDGNIQKRKRQQCNLSKTSAKVARFHKSNFELVVDGVEALRNLVGTFIEPKNSYREVSSNVDKENTGSAEKVNHLLCNLQRLLSDLEPHEKELEEVTGLIRLKLKREWDNHEILEAKHENEKNDFKENDMDEEILDIKTEESSSFLSSFKEDLDDWKCSW